MDNEKNNYWGCLQIIGFFVFSWLVLSGFRQCKCALLRMSDPEPPYFSTDDNLYHRRSCPYMTEDNYVGDEYESMSSAEDAGLSPCPHCLN